MRVIHDIRATRLDDSNPVLTIGSFDGVHLGHRAILDAVVARANANGGTAAVLTLRPHPREFFSPGHAPSLLTHTAKKLELFEQAGIEAVVVLRFDADVAALEPEDFVREIIADRCRAKAVVVGHDFRFGRNARGDFDLLRELSQRHGFDVEQVPPLLMDGERVSSTLIRERLLLGDLEKAEAFLGRPYSLVGRIVPGRHIGSTIGFPTANIQPHHSAIPAQGVYICEAKLAGAQYPAAVNIGVAPTIRNEDLTIEAFLLDFSGNIDGSEIELVFRQRLRSEIKFPTVQDLIAQIHKDVEATRAFFVSARA
ncbi:MAG: bifunctional riboflavin kinase/FAD synthetase [Candidatus Hydrogenedentes bacterium]|nr:bifunctional riboflavin kinase/FAD synthetase [Candidatus Hydrogenedentota bacterium]